MKKVWTVLLSLGLLQLSWAQTKTPATPSAAAPAAASTAATPTATPAAGETPYKVVNGNQVDANTYEGFKIWRAMDCARCHGPNQEGLVGPALVNSLKVLTKEQFVTTVTKGRIERGMPNFGIFPNVVKNIDNLYAYLKGRSDGAITSSRVYLIGSAPAPKPAQ